MTIQIPASALNRVIECNGSIAMVQSVEQPLDREQTDDQREGDAAHHVALMVLTGQISDPLEMVDRKVPNGVYITPDMAEHIDPFVQEMLDDIRAGRAVKVEQNLDFDISAETRIPCRPDATSYDPITGTLKIPDLKYGYRIVEPENWTLIAYAMTWIINNQIVPLHIELVIHQPRPHHEDGKRRSVTMGYSDLLVKYQHMQARLAQLTNELHTGDHCYMCPALVPCRAARNAMFNGIDMSSTVFHDQYTTEDLGNELLIAERAEKMLKDRIAAMRELMMYRIGERSEISQEWTVDHDQFGHKKFLPTVNPELIKIMTGIDIRKDAMLTPAQAIKKGVPESIIDTFTTRPRLAAKLVHKSAAKRAEKLFGKPTT